MIDIHFAIPSWMLPAFLGWLGGIVCGAVIGVCYILSGFKGINF